jgi:uncharacterized membrane protein
MARERRAARARLDQPRDVGRGIPLPSYDPEAFGRLSERVARFLGTWRFIGYMTLFIACWLAWNIFAPHHLQFDPKRLNFTLLTLLLSLQASYAAPLILLAQNRQSDRDRVQYENDRALSERAVDDTEYLAREVAAIRVALGEVATRDYIRGELQRVLEELAESRGEEPTTAEAERSR